MEIESFLRSEIRNINVVDDIFEIIERKINLKVLESNCSDENYEKLYHTKTELQRQIDLYKCDFNEKNVTQKQEDSLIELCCKYLELFFAILHFQRINTNKIETECIDNIIPAQPKVLDIELLAGEEECEIKADVNLESSPSKVIKDIIVEFENKGNEIQLPLRNESCVNESLQCWYKFCRKLNSEKEIFFCKHCGLARNPPKCEEDLVLHFSKIGKIFSEVWICRNCSYFNDKDEVKCKNKKCREFKFYHRTIQEKGGQMKNEEKRKEVWSCENCTFDNKISDKKCKMCNFKKSDVLFIANHWRCWNKNCKQFNKDMFDYCEYCKLSKHSSDEQCDIVKYKDKNGVKDIWVCRTCYKLNDISDFKCKGKGCGIYRYIKI